MDKELFFLFVGAGIALLSSIISATIQHFLSLRAERIKLKMEREIDLEMQEKEREQRREEQERERERHNEEERRKMILEGVQQFALKTALGRYDDDTAQRIADMVTHSVKVELETDKSFRSFVNTTFESGSATQAIQSIARKGVEQMIITLKKQGDL